MRDFFLNIKLLGLSFIYCMYNVPNFQGYFFPPDRGYGSPSFFVT